MYPELTEAMQVMVVDAIAEFYRARKAMSDDWRLAP